ncbi:alcohol dehydrogenase [Erythrobacter sp. SG61-1L]|uniref:PQQ-dependent dehydrogenase, methanol/ethanol family n=1 Tax=Erythrobacter sp. SG61-1L TaxID=1603897 RepID=UPI0006C92152|nr:PQQ-dependent dehydrogenase, methanol/ethanol family [Erythrobacter sp. SG61-1L]KPL69205.1 alcohol dehydrogenase [Erythrobacter sp. SG61-1L]
MFKRALAAAALALLAACSQQADNGAIDEQRLLAAEDDPDNWLSYGRTYAEQRFSPLEDVNDGNVGKLGLAFAVQLDTNRGQEATPIVVDGIMYFSTAWSKVMAVKADTGEVLWQYDPKNIGAKGVHACCDVVNRGVAVWEGKVFVGTIDGRLIALDAASGKELWSTVTVDQKKPYTITMAPRVVRGKVIIGNSGAELGVRGYVSAYDANSGKLVWRFYTVPGNPADGPDGAASDEAFAKFAGKTWNGNWWEMGGGGTVWDSVVYDADFNQLIVGVGNGSPWNHRARSAGKGDNLFLSSILALDPDTGKYKWHYQVNPGETWDFTATQQITLADLTIDGKPRKVLMQAPKNGFFYVIDRSNGKLISAENFVPQNWAEKIDLVTGRPVEKPEARFANKPYMIYPSGLGAHAWMPMSYSPKTGLVYIPAMHAPIVMSDNVNYERHPGRWNTGVNMGGPPPKGQEHEAAFMGWLVAWDPVKQKAAWKVERPWPWNGGTLATGGNLVFQGDAHGQFHAYDARNGKELWTFNAGQGVMAGPITYRVNGVQYVAVLAGYGGSMGMARPADWMETPPPPGQLLVFKVGGTAKLPERPPYTPPPFAVSDEKFTPAQLEEGQKWYLTYCSICHAGPTNPDLFRSQYALSADAWRSVVIDGALQDNGMASFSEQLTKNQAESIRAYMLKLGKEGAAAEAARAGKGKAGP